MDPKSAWPVFIAIVIVILFAGAIVWILSGKITDPVEQKRRCEGLGYVTGRTTKVNGECWIQCPEPVGWITEWMWRRKLGCAPGGGR